MSVQRIARSTTDNPGSVGRGVPTPRRLARERVRGVREIFFSQRSAGWNRGRARILKPGGLAVFTIPGDYPNKHSVTFAQPDDNGHLRHYGMEVQEKFRAAFPQVEVRDMSEGAPPDMHIRRHDMAFICRVSFLLACFQSPSSRSE